MTETPRGRLLIIEDNEDLRAAIQLTLELAGYEVTASPEGDTGLKMQRLRPADVVITDIFMPGMEGMETIHRLRQEFPAVRIIAMSGGGDVLQNLDYLWTAREFGALMILSKPFDTATLLGAVHDALAGP
jgi:DNA-binding response OmpR family regulator